MSGKVFYNLTALQTTKIFFLSSNCTLLVLGAPGDIMYPWTIPVPMYYFCMYMFIFTITCSSTFPSIGTEISDLFSWLIVFCFFEFVVLCRYLCLWLSFFFSDLQTWSTWSLELEIPIHLMFEEEKPTYVTCI